MSDEMVPVSPTIAQDNALAQAEAYDSTRSLATVLAPVQTITCSIVKAVVTAVNPNGTPPNISVQIGGDTSTTVAGVVFLTSYSPVVGDTVELVRQGNEVVALGQVHSGGTPASNGWTAPTLNSGFTTYSFDPFLWRMVVDNGTKKIQTRGRLDISGSPSTICTLPTEARPLFDMAPVIIGREFGGGSATATLDVKASGALNLVGGTVGIQSVSGSSASIASAGSGQTGFTNVNHTHFSSDGPNPATPSSWTTQINTGFTNHDHSVGSHGHSAPTITITPNAVDFPTFISFNGVEWFL